ncbi:hypothetical protein [Tsuneonella amylolytica]|uniref:hypothetical protein n=1 Tax=Tsuneonella amylolytica TaxID=2338327 RepID=UPI0013C4C9B0|nr:hypothetical protein [Tsuneonella amylolytica]
MPGRPRADGWTVERQCGFLAGLYLTGSVAAAARAVGMSRKSAYRLRARAGAEGFARAWDRVLTPPGCGHAGRAGAADRKVTLGDLQRRIGHGLVAPVVHRGRMVGIRRKPDNTALLHYLRRTDATARRVAAAGMWP